MFKATKEGIGIEIYETNKLLILSNSGINHLEMRTLILAIQSFINNSQNGFKKPLKQ